MLEIVTFDSVGRVSKLLDQMFSCLQTLGVLLIVRASTNLLVPLLTNTACISPVEVIKAVYVDDDHCPSDNFSMVHLHKFVGEATEEGMLVSSV